VPERRSHCAAAASAALACISVSASVRAETSFTPTLNAEVTYTDNVNQAPTGQSESETLLGIMPGFDLTSMSNRFEADVRYELLTYMFASDSDQNKAVHTLDATATATLVPELLSVTANGNLGQSIVDPNKPVPTTSLIQTSNLVDTGTWSVTPVLHKDFNHGLSAEASYQYGQVHYFGDNTSTTPTGQSLNSLENSLVRGRIGQGHAASLGEGSRGPLDQVPGASPTSPRSSAAHNRRTASRRSDAPKPSPQGRTEDERRLSWALEYSHQDVSYVGAPSFRSDVATADLELRLRPGLWLVGEGGKETDLTVDQTSGGLDAGFWRGGFRWAPKLRHELRVTAGHRYFGKTYEGSYAYTGRVLTSEVSYTEGYTTQALSLLDRTSLVIGATPTDPTLAPITPDVYLSKLARASVTLEGRVNSIQLSVYSDRRAYLRESRRDDESGVSAEWEYRLGPRTTATLEGSIIKYDFKDQPAARADYFIRASAGIERALGRYAVADFRYRRFQRRSNDVVDPTLQALYYRENALTLSVSFAFR